MTDRPASPRPATDHPLEATADGLFEHLLANGHPPPGRQVFVNRTLRMETIRHVGFDLDWTLADYERMPLEKLTFQLALDRLIEAHGYPDETRRVEFRPDFPRRGLLIDRQAGTVLRMSRHRYVNRAYYGRQRLDRDALRRLYRSEPIHPASQRFYHLDSLFELPEANLYSELIELSRAAGREVAPDKLFDEVRGAIDWVHASGALKGRVLADTSRYLRRDPELAQALFRLALGGRRLILLTNSDWPYAAGLCAHLFDRLLPGLDSWRQLFDLVIVAAGKPDFFRLERPFVELDDEGDEVGTTEVPSWGGVYSGGGLEGLMRLVDEPGETVLYVGDHVYGDIVTSKRESTWRTALVVRELEEEIYHRGRSAGEMARHERLKERLADLGRRMDHARDLVALARRPGSAVAGRRSALAADFQALVAEHRRVLAEEAACSEEIAQRFNPYWGPFFKQGTIKTRFASQLETYACLYTSRVSNFGFYGTDHYFRVIRDPMRHELEE